MAIKRSYNIYTSNTGTTPSNSVIQEDRAPSTTDINYPLYQDWHNTTDDSFWRLADFVSSDGVVTATWVELGGGDVDVESFAVSTGASPVSPDSDNEITLTDGNGVGMTGGTNAITFDMVSPFTGNFTFTKSTAAETQVLTVSNTDNTAASASSANLILSVGGTTQIGDPYVSLVTSTSRSYAIGTDTSASQTLKVTTAADETANPSSGTEVFSLTTSGAAKFANAFTFPTADGSANQVLTTDGAGNVDWQGNGRLVLIETQTFIDSATVDFTGLSTLKNILVVIQGIRPATTGADLHLLVSTNNGSSFLGSGYAGGVNMNAYNSATLTNTNSTSVFPLFVGQINISASTSGLLYLDLSSEFKMHGQLTGNDGAIAFGQSFGQGVSNVNAIRFMYSTGNIEGGVINVYLIDGTG